jgi:hypothetical protein
MEWLDYNHVVPGDVRLQMWLAFGFLLVCLVNTIGLLLAKFLRRSGEIGVRRALGASRAEIFKQCLVEAGTIGLAGGVLGLGWPNWACWRCASARPVTRNWRIWTADAGADLRAGHPRQPVRRPAARMARHAHRAGHPAQVAVTHCPAFRRTSWKSAPSFPAAQASHRRRTDRAGDRAQLRDHLQRAVPGEPARGGAASPQRHRRTRIAADPLGGVGKQTDADARSREDMAALRAIPGVSGVSIVNQMPFQRGSWNTSLACTPDQEVATLNAAQYMTTPGLMKTRLKLVAGRDFRGRVQGHSVLEQATDTNGMTGSIIVSEWPQEVPRWRRRAASARPCTWPTPLTIVGVVER